ncbi:MAG: response regulator [bacterium]|nr:response regulator [bacterium]
MIVMGNTKYKSKYKTKYKNVLPGLLVLLFLLMPAYPHLYAQKHYLRFEHISIDDGLSQNSIECMLQDDKGYMWFGTLDGLNRYDGYEIKLYKHEQHRPATLSGNSVMALAIDKDGVMWAGTNSGLNRYDKESGTFTRFKHESSNLKSISHNKIRVMYRDASGELWIGTPDGLNKYDGKGGFTVYRNHLATPSLRGYNYITCIYEDTSNDLWVGNLGGLNRFDKKNGRFTFYRCKAPNTRRLEPVFCIIEDNSGTLWVGTNSGLNKFDKKNGRFIRYSHPLLEGNRINDICTDQSGVMWIGTANSGLLKFDQTTPQITRYAHHNAASNSLSNNYVYKIMEDRSGVLWVGTLNGGLNKYDLENRRFRLYRHDASDNYSLNNDCAGSVLEDSAGTLWVGTDTGLNKFHRKTGSATLYKNDPSNPRSITGGTVTYIYEDTTATLWVGTMEGLNQYHPKQENFKRYLYEPTEPHSISSNAVSGILEDRSGTLWVGTYNRGLNKLDRDTGRFTRYQFSSQQPHSLPSNSLSPLYEDHFGVLWVGTSLGLSRFNRSEGNFANYLHDDTNPHSISHNDILSICEDVTGTLWFGTSGGLNTYSRETKRFKAYRIKDGLPNETIYGVLGDKQGNIWMSTNKGLSRLNPKTGTFKNFDAADGLQSNEFNTESYFQNTKGEMFFGGLKGLNSFFPGDIRDNPYLPPVVITDFLLLNRSVKLKQHDPLSPLEKKIDETGSLTLSYKDYIITFEFAALHFAAPQKNRYAYKLEGLDKEWIETGARNRRATYTKLPPGNYLFRVRGSNKDGVWNQKGTAIKLKILPPPWKTWWAYLLYILVAVVVLSIIPYLISKKKNEVQLRNARDTAEQAKESAESAREAAEQANRAKSEFLANMSHEIRTPMNALLGFSEILSHKIQDPQLKDYLSAIGSSGKTLLALINDILDLSKIEAGKLEMEYEPVNPRSILREIGQIFSQQVSVKDIGFHTEISRELPDALLLDEVRISQVIFNLVGNAIKFTPSGHVKISLSSENKEENSDVTDVIIAVEDTGIGIEKDQQEIIFGAFQQQKGQKFKKFGGTGLGLAITQRLVHLMNGELSVKSKPGKGSTFYVKLRDVQVTSAGKVDAAGKAIAPDKILFEGAAILIADDILYNRELLKGYLEEYNFSVIEALNGREAVEFGREYQPDLVLMDMKMPEMSGYDATKIFKSDSELKRIPIIVLTASAMKEEEQEIIELGCDSFLKKPISRKDIITEFMKYLPYTLKEATPENAGQSVKEETAEPVIPLSPEIKAKIPELVEILETDLYEEWEFLTRTFIIDEIEEFAGKIKKLGDSYQVEILSKFGNKLFYHIETFDIENIIVLMNGFPELTRDVKKLEE